MKFSVGTSLLVVVVLSMMLLSITAINSDINSRISKLHSDFSNVTTKYWSPCSNSGGSIQQVWIEKCINQTADTCTLLENSPHLVLYIAFTPSQTYSSEALFNGSVIARPAGTNLTLTFAEGYGLTCSQMFRSYSNSSNYCPITSGQLVKYHGIVYTPKATRLSSRVVVQALLTSVADKSTVACVNINAKVTAFRRGANRT